MLLRCLEKEREAVTLEEEKEEGREGICQSAADATRLHIYIERIAALFFTRLQEIQLLMLAPALVKRRKNRERERERGLRVHRETHAPRVAEENFSRRRSAVYIGISSERYKKKKGRRSQRRTSSKQQQQLPLLQRRVSETENFPSSCGRGQPLGKSRYIKRARHIARGVADIYLYYIRCCRRRRVR